MKEDKKKLILEKLKEIEELLEDHPKAHTQETTPTQPPPYHPGKP
jgi:hypothetical protein